MYARAIELPPQEPVTLTDAKSFIGLPASNTAFDSLLLGFTQAAREQGEIITGRSLARRKFVQSLDSMPYYTDSITSQLAYPPAYSSLPRYSSTLWNYSQMIKLLFSPVWSVEAMTYVGTDGHTHDLLQDTDFILDRNSEPARIFPVAGQYWPANLYVPNSCLIQFTAGYDSNPTKVDTHTVVASPPNQQAASTLVMGIPQMIILGIMNLVAYWFNNRGCAGQVPDNIAQIFQQNAVVDFAPTRG